MATWININNIHINLDNIRSKFVKRILLGLFLDSLFTLTALSRKNQKRI